MYFCIFSQGLTCYDLPSVLSLRQFICVLPAKGVTLLGNLVGPCVALSSAHRGAPETVVGGREGGRKAFSPCLPCPGIPFMASQGGDHSKCYLSPPAAGATTSAQPSPSPQRPPVSFSCAVSLYIHIRPATWGTTHPISDACRLFSTVQPGGSYLLPTELG